MASPAFRSSNSGTATSTSISGGDPAGAASGDILIWPVALEAGFTGLVDPSGWTKLYAIDCTAFTALLYAIRRGGSAPSYAVSWTGSHYYDYSIHAISGAVASGTFIDGQAASTPTNAASTVDPPAITTTTIDTLAVAVAYPWAGWQIGGATPPSGYTLRFGGTGFDEGLATKALATATTENPAAFTNVASTDWSVGITLAIASLAVAGATTQPLDEVLRQTARRNLRAYSFAFEQPLSALPIGSLVYDAPARPAPKRPVVLPPPETPLAALVVAQVRITDERAPFVPPRRAVAALQSATPLAALVPPVRVLDQPPPMIATRRPPRLPEAESAPVAAMASSSNSWIDSESMVITRQPGVIVNDDDTGLPALSVPLGAMPVEAPVPFRARQPAPRQRADDVPLLPRPPVLEPSSPPPPRARQAVAQPVSDVPLAALPIGVLPQDPAPMLVRTRPKVQPTQELPVAAFSLGVLPQDPAPQVVAPRPRAQPVSQDAPLLAMTQQLGAFPLLEQLGVVRPRRAVQAVAASDPLGALVAPLPWFDSPLPPVVRPRVFWPQRPTEAPLAALSGPALLAWFDDSRPLPVRPRAARPTPSGETPLAALVPSLLPWLDDRAELVRVAPRVRLALEQPALPELVRAWLEEGAPMQRSVARRPVLPAPAETPQPRTPTSVPDPVAAFQRVQRPFVSTIEPQLLKALVPPAALLPWFEEPRIAVIVRKRVYVTWEGSPAVLLARAIFQPAPPRRRGSLRSRPHTGSLRSKPSKGSLR